MVTINDIQNNISAELSALNAIIEDTLRSSSPLMQQVVQNFLRPILVILSGKYFGEASKPVLYAGAAIELLHNASLIHDDVIDESRERRGLPTINRVWDNHIAVLVGDFFVSGALHCAEFTKDFRVITAMSSLGRALSLGEIEQIDNARSRSVDEETYINIIRKKTASLFCSCVQVGGYAAGAPEDQLRDLMAYADQFEIEGIFTTVGWNCDPYPQEWADYLRKVMDAYEKDVKKLMARSGQKKFASLAKENGKQRIGYWPSPEYIRGRAMMGSTHGGIKVVGEGNDSPGSNLLIRLADEPDERPIWVAAWGGANTLAQAIWRVKQTRTPEQVRQFVRKFRIYTITDQDMQYSMRMNRAYSSHQWLRQEFQNDLKFIWDEGTWQLQCDLGKEYWEEHEKYIQGKGALGAEYPKYKWGVEGDTPSFLYVMPNGLSDPEDPTQVNWGGYHQFGLCPDSLTYAWTSWEQPTYNTTRDYKRYFYPDELNDFKARMQWADEGWGNTNPHVIVNGKKYLNK